MKKFVSVLYVREMIIDYMEPVIHHLEIKLWALKNLLECGIKNKINFILLLMCLFMNVYSPPKAVTNSGAPVRGHADFPTEAVQSFHEKPLPTHDSRPAHSNKPGHIQQPRKQ